MNEPKPGEGVETHVVPLPKIATVKEAIAWLRNTWRIPGDSAHNMAAVIERDYEALRERAERAEESLRGSRLELNLVLRDWNALVQAIGSPTHGGAVGYAAALKAKLAEVERERDEARASRDQWKHDACALMEINKAIRPALEAAESQVAELRKALEDMARWIVDRCKEKASVDFACAECRPDGGLVIDGFQCVPHRAVAALTSTTPTGSAGCGEERDFRRDEVAGLVRKN